jgi:hypothetical protein
MKRLLAPAIAPMLLLAACDSKTAAPAAPAETRTVATSIAPPSADASAANFQHDAKLDLTGFYFTETPVQQGNWKLTALSIGGQSDFASWEQGKRPEHYGPIFLSFEDVTSPSAENELGQVNHTVELRLMPDSYRVDGQEILFRANDPRLGEVVLSGVMDVAKLKAAKTAGPNGGVQIVLTGSLQVGAQRIRNISFFYHPGE